MRETNSPTTPETLTRHLHSALRDADDPEVRYHIRHVLQYVEAERSAASNVDHAPASADGR